jgi:hypothetical protein
MIYQNKNASTSPVHKKRPNRDEDATTPWYHPDFCIRANTLTACNGAGPFLPTGKVQQNRSKGNFIRTPTGDSVCSRGGVSLGPILRDGLLPLSMRFNILVHYSTLFQKKQALNPKKLSENIREKLLCIGRNFDIIEISGAVSPRHACSHFDERRFFCERCKQCSKKIRKQPHFDAR